MPVNNCPFKLGKLSTRTGNGITVDHYACSKIPGGCIDHLEGLNLFTTNPAVCQGHATKLPTPVYTLKWKPVAPVLPINKTRDRLVVTVATGETYKKLLEVTEPLLRAYAIRCDADFQAITDTTQEWWGFEKFRIRELAQHYNHILYIDVDCIPTENCRDLFEFSPGNTVGIFDDWEYIGHQVDPSWVIQEFNSLMLSQGITPRPTLSRCLNSGIVIFGIDNIDIWSPPLEPVPNKHCSEQMWVDYNISKLGVPITELPLSCNLQWWMKNVVDEDSVRQTAEIVHLSSCPSSERIELAKSLIKNPLIKFHKSVTMPLIVRNDPNLVSVPISLQAIVLKEPVGTLLHQVIAECGVQEPPGCNCNSWRIKMDGWGITQCNEHRQEILDHLNEAASKGSWLDMFKVGVKGYTSTGSLLDEALSRATKFRKPVYLNNFIQTIEVEATEIPKINTIKWAYGLTTVPSRITTTLPKTLESLAAAGFDKPHLFVDGCVSPDMYLKFGCEVTTRWPVIDVAGNWILALQELYIRNPQCNRYAIFQDDLVISKNARQYLDTLTYGTDRQSVYWNLHTFPQNEVVKIPTSSPPVGVKPSAEYQGFYDSDQNGKSALALVFDRPAVIALLSSSYVMYKFQDDNPIRAHRSVDGCIVTAMKTVGYKELVHSPSLTQHIGHESTIGHSDNTGKSFYPLAPTFRGESFDAMELSCLVTK